MASSMTSRQCVKCKDNSGSFTCEGCAKVFCIKHCIEHRQELGDRFEHLLTEHNEVLQQMQDRKHENEPSKKVLFDGIDSWEKTMIKKVREIAEKNRQRLVQLIENENKLVLDKIQVLADEIRRRHEKEDFLEPDIERIKQNINELQLTFNKSMDQSDIELHVDSDHMINWDQLIWVKEKSLIASSSVTNKETGEKSNRENEGDVGRYPAYYPDYFRYSASSCYIPPGFIINDTTGATNVHPSNVPMIRPTNSHLVTNTVSYSYPYSQLSSQNPHEHQIEQKRTRKPLVIKDPVTHKLIEKETSAQSVDTNNSSPQAASVNLAAGSSSPNSLSTHEKAQTQADIHRRILGLFGVPGNDDNY